MLWEDSHELRHMFGLNLKKSSIILFIAKLYWAFVFISSWWTVCIWSESSYELKVTRRPKLFSCPFSTPRSGFFRGDPWSLRGVFHATENSSEHHPPQLLASWPTRGIGVVLSQRETWGIFQWWVFLEAKVPTRLGNKLLAPAGHRSTR